MSKPRGLDSQLQNVVVHNHKGGSGKTTLAVHLSWYLMEYGRNVVLLDLDEQDNAIRWITQFEWDGSPAVDVHTDDRGTLAAVSLDADTAVDLANERNAVLIVDTPPAYDLFDRLPRIVYPESDDIFVLPVGGRLSLDGAVAVLEEIEARGLNTRVRIVANQLDPKKQEAAQSQLRTLEELEKAFPQLVVFRVAVPSNYKMHMAERHGERYWERPYADRTYTGKSLRAALGWIASGAYADDAQGTGFDGLDTDLSERLSI